MAALAGKRVSTADAAWGEMEVGRAVSMHSQRVSVRAR
jgi:hypothetical protein